MIQFRPFRNTDPPQLAAVWRSQTTQRGLMQPMSVAVLERFVFSKPTFDPRGLIVAVDADKMLGFAHAGFGPAEDQSTLSTHSGVTCLVMLRPDAEGSIAAELLARSEEFLRTFANGANPPASTAAASPARILYGGGSYPLSPFYFGLYGGGEFSGVLDSDARMQAIFCDHGYRAAKRSLVLQRELAGFRPLIDRQQMQIRRHTTVETIADPPTATWWEACVFEPFDRTRCALMPRDGGPAAAAVNFWNMETMAGAWGVHAGGVAGLEVPEGQQRQGLATYLLGEAMRHLHTQGVAVAEVHVAEDNSAGLALFGKLGFEQVDASVLYCKD